MRVIGTIKTLTRRSAGNSTARVVHIERTDFMNDEIAGSFRHEGTMKLALWVRKAHRDLSSPRLAVGVFFFLMFLAAGRALAASDDDSFFTHLHTEKAMANVTISPGRAGPVDITIQLETTDELPLTAKAVSLTLLDAQSGSDIQTFQATRSSDDQWHVRTSMRAPGRWILGLGISISETDSVNIESPILIK
jgi:hypothetical protein